VRLIDGPLTIDVEQVMLHAAQHGELRSPPSASPDRLQEAM
jgi:hypothetical protein